jgi:hypothetical protein
MEAVQGTPDERASRRRVEHAFGGVSQNRLLVSVSVAPVFVALVPSVHGGLCFADDCPAPSSRNTCTNSPSIPSPRPTCPSRRPLFALLAQRSFWEEGACCLPGAPTPRICSPPPRHFTHSLLGALSCSPFHQQLSATSRCSIQHQRQRRRRRRRQTSRHALLPLAAPDASVSPRRSPPFGWASLLSLCHCIPAWHLESLPFHSAASAPLHFLGKHYSSIHICNCRAET